MSRHWTPRKTELEAGVRGLAVDDVKDDTKLVMSQLHHNAGQTEDPIVQPIIHSTIYRIKNVDHYHTILQEGGRIYVRLGNSTCEAAEAAINQLEGGAGSVVCSSGMAAVSTALLSFLKSGDHVVTCNPIYSGTHDLLINHFRDLYNIEVTIVGRSVDEFRKAIKPNTKVLYGETPCNPDNMVLDLEEFGKLGKSLPGVVTIIDSTFGTPYLQKPIKHGVDIVVHSATKYLGGHSDMCAGVATASTLEQWKKMMMTRKAFGGILSPFDASLLLRGLKTLHVRVGRQSDTAQRLAEYLQAHPKILHVHYPGLQSHSGHEVAKKQMKKFGGMISFEMKGGLQAAKTCVESVRIVCLAVSLGGPETLMEHPATMSHGPMVMDDEERTEASITGGLIRLSVGLEDPDDLMKDFEQALAKVV